MQYRKDKRGEDLSLLGYGCMRFTTRGRSIDLDKAEQEILTAYRAGVNYYDTAYIYPGSEVALGQILEKNGIREKVKIATKLPQYMIASRGALDKYFEEQLAAPDGFYRLLPDASSDGSASVATVKGGGNPGLDPGQKGAKSHSSNRLFFSWQYGNVPEDPGGLRLGFLPDPI